MSSLIGTVLRSHAGGYLVHLPQDSEEDFVLFCQARGRLKKQKVAILTGDRVELDEVNFSERTAVIVQQQERKTFIDRPPLANIDQVVIVQAVRQPDFDPLWMDRYLVHFQLSVPFTRPIICLNKCDLEDDYGLLRLRSIYEPLGYFVIFASAHTGVGLQELAGVLAGKVSVFSGPSGVGKSSLLNKLSPGLAIKVGRMDNAFGVGRHTTTYSELYKLDLEALCSAKFRNTSQGEVLGDRVWEAVGSIEGLGNKSGNDIVSALPQQSLEITQNMTAWVADTPGFNVMEFMQSDPRAVAAEFPEIVELSQYCKYSDCLHTVEADCAVLTVLGLSQEDDDDATETDVDDSDCPDSSPAVSRLSVDVLSSESSVSETVEDALTPEQVELLATMSKIQIVPSRYQSYCTMVAEAQEMQLAAKTVSTKKESSIKSVGGEDASKVRIIPRLAGRYRAVSRKSEKQKLPRVEDFSEDDDSDYEE